MENNFWHFIENIFISWAVWHIWMYMVYLVYFVRCILLGMVLQRMDYVGITLLMLRSSLPYTEILACVLSSLSPPPPVSLSHCPVSLSLSLPVIDMIFLQNLGLVCLQSITLILEDDFNKQVTLSRGGQILTSPNQGFSLNGKTQYQWQRSFH